MNDNVDDVIELYSIVKDFFGYKAGKLYLDSDEKEVTCTLYESFVFKCDINGRYGTFGGGILMASGDHITTFLGENLSLNSDKQSILNSLEKVDRYCRLKLPDKFLEALATAYEESKM